MDRDFDGARERLVGLLRAEGIRDAKVLGAIGRVRRERFIPAAHRSDRDMYGNYPWGIGYGQTISQPFIVAYMTEALDVKEGERVLEVGTGSGYQAAVLAELGARVYSIETVEWLAEHARAVLAAEGYESVHVRLGDGYQGWAGEAPFDAILATCAPPDVPPTLVGQLREGGRMILPVGVGEQRLVRLKREGGVVYRRDDLPVRFVPMVPGSAGGGSQAARAVAAKTRG